MHPFIYQGNEGYITPWHELGNDPEHQAHYDNYGDVLDELLQAATPCQKCKRVLNFIHSTPVIAKNCCDQCGYKWEEFRVDIDISIDF